MGMGWGCQGWEMENPGLTGWDCQGLVVGRRLGWGCPPGMGWGYQG